jgi:hypothetical protein
MLEAGKGFTSWTRAIFEQLGRLRAKMIRLKRREEKGVAVPEGCIGSRQ